MTRHNSSLGSKALLVLGICLILAGVGWTAWSAFGGSGPVIDSEAGAVVLAVTASLPAADTPLPAARPSPTMPLTLTRPAINRRLSTEFYARAKRPTPAPAAPTATATSTPLPATPTPTSSPLPAEPPTRIVAPAIELDAEVVPIGYQLASRGNVTYTDWLVPQDVAGWHNTSALPGQAGNTVISGHHNIDGKVFRYLIDLELGDEVTLYAGQQSFAYVVTEKYILKEAGMPMSVRLKNAQWIAPTGDVRLTLVTCWPYQWPGNTHRLIIVARPLEPVLPSLPGGGPG